MIKVTSTYEATDFRFEIRNVQDREGKTVDITIRPAVDHHGIGIEVTGLGVYSDRVLSPWDLLAVARRDKAAAPLPVFRVRAHVPAYDGEDDAPAVALASFVVEGATLEAATEEAKTYEAAVKRRYKEAYGRTVRGPVQFTVTPLAEWVATMLEIGKELAAERDELRFDTGET